VAVVKDPALSQIASGNVGAICYQRWRGLFVAKKAWEGTVPNTTLQIEAQTRMISVAQAWGETLTQDQRSGWNELAATVSWKTRSGMDWVPSGYSVFMRWNIQRLRMGLVLAADPPSVVSSGAPSYMSLSTTTGFMLRVELNNYPSIGVPYGNEYWIAGPFASGGYHAREGDYRFLTFTIPPAAYEWAPLVEKWYWAKARWVMEAGNVGNWWEKQHFYSML
jgi:hypothetical protein